MVGSVQFGHYLLIDRISAGGMAEVYLAMRRVSPGQGRVVAIKRILPTVGEDADFLAMFNDEAQISARLRHENIGQVLEFGEVDGRCYIAMEYIAGKDLQAIQSLLDQAHGVMEASMALHIMARVCDALDYAHHQRDADGKSIAVQRLLEEGRQVVSASLPAVVGTTKGINEPRYTSFIGIRKAAKMEYPLWTLDDVGADAGKVGAAGSGVRWPQVFMPPVREGEAEIIEGETVEEAAAILVDKLLAEKVI